MYIVFTCMHTYTQLGMQPIDFAAQGGHMNVIDALVNDYGVDPNTKVSFSHTLYAYYLRSYYVTM